MSEKMRPLSPTLATLSRFSRKRTIPAAAIFIICLISVIILRGNISTSSSASGLEDVPSVDLEYGRPQESSIDFLMSEHYLAGPPTAHFRDSLRNDTQYLTSWLSAGWTNDVMTIGNLVYLALITSRVPIIPPFTSHIGGSNGPIAFSEIFDIPRLIRAIRAPVLEWHQVKDPQLADSLGEQDELGCWNIWEVDNIPADGPRGSYTTVMLNLDISYTRAPEWVKLIPGYQHDSHSSFWSLARLAFPDTRAEILSTPSTHPTRPSESHGVVLPPDQQLVCYDYLYYLCGNQPSEYEYDYSPAWRFVVKHFRWTEPLEELAKGYVRRTLNIPDGQPIPPFTTIHVRRGDFVSWCGDEPRDSCFAPLSAFARRVFEVQQELRDRHGIEATHVIMTGDEKDETWWEAVKELGWLRIDHEREKTVEQYGKWYTVTIDAVIQSLGMGFVGTDRSTFSILARRRVQDWNHGVVRTVMWGHPDSDMH